MKHVRAALAGLLVMAGCSAAWAQNDACVDPATREIDVRGTQALRDAMAATGAGIRQRLAGTWYAEIPSPELNTVDYQYQSYAADGIFTYQSRICGGIANMCSDFAGHGLWGAHGDGTAEFTTVVVVSDMNRDRECFGGPMRFIDDNSFQNSAGVVWRRVQ